MNHASTRRGISEYLFEQVDVEFAGRGGAFLWILFTAQRVELNRTSVSHEDMVADQSVCSQNSNSGR